MGFTLFRGKASDQPVTVTEADASSTGADINNTNPEADLKKFRKLHTFDPFLDIDKLEAVDNVLVTGDVEKEAAVEEQLLAEDSPYPEVRSSVSSHVIQYHDLELDTHCVASCSIADQPWHKGPPHR